MIRMIANNTSDYVATDLIHQLWCQHDEKYGFLFPNEPHANSKRACLFNHASIESIKKKYVTGGDNYKYPEQPSRINFENQSKSNNYVYPEKEYSEARLRMYAEKHNINGKNDNEKNSDEKNSLQSSRISSGKAYESNSSSDEYCKLIRRRIGLALLENTDKGAKAKGMKKMEEKKKELIKSRRPLLVPTNCPLINDDTTNSDDSDSYEEQAFHQHHTREANEKEEREYNERLLLIQHEQEEKEKK